MGNTPTDSIAILYQPRFDIILVVPNEIVNAVLTQKGKTVENSFEPVAPSIEADIEDFIAYAKEHNIPLQCFCGFLFIGVECVEVFMQ